MSKTKIPLAQAQVLADKIIKELAPVCERVQVAGSVRRQKAEIGDIEIVAIARHQLDLFGTPGASLLEPELETLAARGRIIKGDKWGPKYKKFHIPARRDLAVDLFITTPEEWGYTFTIRTGSAEFSHRLVTPKQQGGFLPGDLWVGSCRLWRDGKALDTPEEKDFLEALGIGWIEPENR